MIAVVAAEHAASATAALEAHGERVYRIGVLTPRADGAAAVILNGAEGTWPR
jgi:phosphoribosylaminoimidazole (AIR) synthetase